jgi:DNA-binding CsgD family transcriptional regulator
MFLWLDAVYNGGPASRPVCAAQSAVYGDDDHVFQPIGARACGYLLKELMFQKIAPPRAQDRQLTPRQFQILRLLADGHSYKTCADLLSLSLDTVRFHVRHIYEQPHVHSKSEAVLKALRSGLIS